MFPNNPGRPCIRGFVLGGFAACKTVEAPVNEINGIDTPATEQLLIGVPATPVPTVEVQISEEPEAHEEDEALSADNSRTLTEWVTITAERCEVFGIIIYVREAKISNWALAEYFESEYRNMLGQQERKLNFWSGTLVFLGHDMWFRREPSEWQQSR